MGHGRLLTAGVWGLALLLSLAPVLLVRAPPTVDGPAHTYNAWVAHELARHPTSPLADAFGYRPAAGQMLVTHGAFRALGPVLGWEAAERLWLGLLMAGLLFTLGWSVRRRVAGGDEESRFLSAPFIVAWLPAGWVTAWGFYDFLLGMVLFAVLLEVLERHRPPVIAGLLAALYLAHLFAFAAGIGALVFRALGRRELRPLAAGAAVAGVALVVLAPGMGGITWDVVLRHRLTHLIIGGALVSVSATAIVAGGVWTTLLVIGAVRLTWSWRVALGLLMLVACLVAPRAVGIGTFVFERLHALALITVAPVAVRVAARLPRPIEAGLALVMAGTLAGVSTSWVRAGRQLDDDRRRITALLVAADAGPGDALTSAFPHRAMAHYRAPLYFHLVDRSAVDVGAVVADNYQASAGVFPVVWAPGRAPVRAGQRGSAWDVIDGDGMPLLVVHSSGVSDRRRQARVLAEDGRFTISQLEVVIER